jgi:hypothetical protein
LTAAGLGAWHFDGATRGFEQGDRREADAGPVQVDQAGYEQGDARMGHGGLP